MFSYYIPTQIIFGDNEINNIENYITRFNPRNVLLVTGRTSMKKAGITDKILQLLGKYQVYLYDKISTNPTIESLNECIDLIRQKHINLVIALGGGSVLDYAKASSVLVNNKGPIKDYFNKKKKLDREGIPVVAISTTAGTSSEVTPYAVMTDLESKIKITLASDFIYPKLAIIDPRLSLSMPSETIANSGIDALCHAVEAYWNKRHNSITDIFALKAIALISNNLEKTYKNPKTLLYRRNMNLAVLYAGLAFSNTRTTACHSVSYPLTTVFGIPHGNACALTLGAFLNYNSEKNRKRIFDICGALGVKTIKTGVKRIRQIMETLNLKTNLRAYGIRKSDIRIIIEKGFTPERMKNNPRVVTKDNLRKILEGIY